MSQRYVPLVRNAQGALCQRVQAVDNLGRFLGYRLEPASPRVVHLPSGRIIRAYRDEGRGIRRLGVVASHTETRKTT